LTKFTPPTSWVWLNPIQSFTVISFMPRTARLRRLFFADDTLKNVLAARNLGIVSFHFTEPSALEERLKEYL